MAYDLLNALGNNQYGVMSDVDKANFGSQQSAQDFILRKRLQDEAYQRTQGDEAARLAAEQAMQGKALAAQKEIGGTFDQKNAAETARANLLISPQMEALKQSGAIDARDWAAGQDIRDASHQQALMNRMIQEEMMKAGNLSQKVSCRRLLTPIEQFIRDIRQAPGDREIE